MDNVGNSAKALEQENFTCETLEAISVVLGYANFKCNPFLGVTILSGDECGESTPSASANTPNIGKTIIDMTTLLKQHEELVVGRH